MPPPLDKAALAHLSTMAEMVADGTTWHLKVNDPRGQLWLSADGTRLKVYHWGENGPWFVREE